VLLIRPVHAQAFAAAAADRVAEVLLQRPHAVLALPTGRTPLGLYAELVRRSRAGSLGLHQARIFNLDEFCTVPAEDPHSYAAFLERELIRPAGVHAERVRLLRGDAADLPAECRSYDAALAACGGIDLCVLGLGANGHIAFNEPGTAWDLRTHVVRLTERTRAAQQPLTPTARPGAELWRCPTHGITLGIRTLLESRKILLLIAGEDKEAARDALHRGRPDPAWPVTSLIGHPDCTVIELCGRAGSR